MKKILIMLALLLMPLTVNAFHIEGFEKDINITLNCDDCKDKETREIKIKLFADGEEVPDSEIILNNANDFSGVYEELPIFLDDGFTEIEYEVRFLEDGVYKPFSKTETSYEKANVSKWMSVYPEDVKPGDTIMLVTDNWNHDMNGGPELVITSGDMRLYGINIVADYKIIDGKKSYYSIDDETYDEDEWDVSSVTSDELLYEGFENYVHLKNNEGKNMSLSGFDKGDYIDYVFRQTSKPDGYNDSENSWNTSKVELLPIEDELGRFYITSHNIINDEVRGTRYLGVDHNQNVVAQKEQEYGAHFIVFKYFENMEEEQVYNVHINRTICKNLEDLRKIQLSDSVDVLGVFEDVTDVTGIDFDIVDPSIVKVENGKVIPLKIGETDISFKYGFTDYMLHIIVYDVPNNNPNTDVGAIITLIAITVISGSLYLVLKNKKRISE